jgi:hypothetical protein
MGLTRPKLAQVTTTTAAFNDPIIVLNNDPLSGANTYDIGVVFERGDDQNRAFLWDESADEFVLVNTTEQGSTNGDVTIAAYANLQVATLTASSLSTGAFTLPATDGTSGQTLVTDGSGNVTWSSAGGGGHTIQNNSVDLTSRTNLNFDGTYLVATDDAGNDQNDVTVSSALQTWHSTTNNASNWDTAYGWGNHASQGYVTSLSDLSITATATELNYTDGVTSNIQTQLDGKATAAQGALADTALQPTDTIDGGTY